MSIDIAASLNERQRNALLSYYLGQYVPASNNSHLVDLVQTPEDVYEYLLIDPLVSNAVPTSRVAQAMSSIQQYINGICMNMEPGYSTQSLDPHQITQWTEGASQYDIWAGEVELDTYPENYIDPTLRQSQTAYFKELITDLNQKTINSDTAQQAVMNYLNKFEQVANLDIISGYIDGLDQSTDMYYLLGKTTATPGQYYWRSFDMSQNHENVISSSAWSEWFPMNTAINEDALQGTPRLTYFNNRLYLFWFERTTAGSNADGTTYDSITAWSSYCDFSNNWSTPYSLMSVKPGDNGGYCDTLFDAQYLNTVCMYDQIDNVVTISLYAGDNITEPDSEPEKNSADFSLNIDYWFNIKQVQAGYFNGSNGSALSQYLYHFMSNATFPTHQRLLQTAYAIGSLVVQSVTCIATHDDLNGISALPVLDFTDFTFTTSGKWTLTGKIPQSVDTHGSYDLDDYSLLWEGINSVVASFNLFTGKDTTITDLSLTSIYRGPYKFNYVCLTVGNTKEKVKLSKMYTLLNYTEINEKITFPIDSSVMKSNFYIYLEFIQDSTTILEGSATLKPNSPWTFNVFSDDKSGSWTNSGHTNEFTITADNFFATSDYWSFNVSDFTDSEISAGAASRFISFGYTNAANKMVTNEYEVSIVKPTSVPSSPIISYGTNSGDGSAVYLDYSQTPETTISAIRLNTLFAKELINKASASMQALLNWDTQLTLEPPMTSTGTGNSVPMDFYGANGIYFWELFFYMPYLVAWRLNQEQQYQDALSWYHYIFDPAARGRNNSSVVGPDLNTEYPEPDYWSVRPLVETPSTAAQAAASSLTTDPDSLASANPVQYQKAVFMAYVNTLIAAADASYRLLTNDGLSLARLQYGQVKDLLGMRPDTLIVNHWSPESLGFLAGEAYQGSSLRQFEQSTSPLPAFFGSASVAAEASTSDNFMPPVNSQLLGYWNTLDSRLYNLRHQLTLDGQPMTIPLYAPPVNPTVLMEQSVQGGSLISTASGVVATIPPYRFRTMLQNAKEAAGLLSQFGQTLLSYCERGDGANLQEIDQQQLLNISGFTLSLQQNALDALDKDKIALDDSQAMAQQRKDYYDGLIKTGLSYDEKHALDNMNDARITYLSASPLIVAGGAANMVPNIFGLADGGCVWGGAVEASGQALEISSQALLMSAQSIDTSAGYERRSEEWTFQSNQAQSEIDCIAAQLTALSIRREGAVISQQLAQAQQDNLKSTLTFLTTRFSQASLYNWLQGQLSALYYQAYDSVLSLCLSTEASWQYEMGDITSRFIQTNAWNDNYRGLLVGETLQLNLQQMESAWLGRNSRRLELTKTVSLKKLLAANDWTALQSSGKASFSLTEKLFDNDYPGHYLRQIKSITVSLPALIGPYQDVRMTLTQSGSQTLLKATIDGVNYLIDPTKGKGSDVLLNPRASQQVAISTGLNDAGLFELNFGDDRYLPFEGTGAVSSWQIAFPNPTSTEQAALLASLNDVIVQVHYTALYGGSAFEQSVIAALKTPE